MWNALKSASPSVLALWAMPLALVLFICINVIASQVLDDAQVDLTEDGIYTVSDSTREVLAAVPEPITLRLYESSALIEASPELRVYAERVRELLRTYERLSGGMVRVERIDPIPFSRAEDKVLGYNLVALNLGRGGEQGYFGLVGTNSVDQLEVIEVLAPARERYLEYEITRMVLRLSRPSEPRVGVIDGLGLFGSMEDGRRPSAIIDRLGDDFALVPIEMDADDLPPDLDALVIVHPVGLTAEMLRGIDRYVVEGGPALVFLDALAEHSAPHPSDASRPRDPASTLEPLLSAWGISFDPQAVVGDISMAIDIRARSGNQVAITKYPPWLIVDQDNLSSEDIVTSRLSLMRISSAGALEPAADIEAEFRPLVQTTPATMLYDQAALIRRNDPRALVRAFEPSGIGRVLAARITGVVSSAYADSPSADGSPGQGAHREMYANVIVVSDTDMLADDLNLDRDGRVTNQNVEFVVNALDSLVGEGALNELRARGLSFRPFTRIDNMEAEAEARYRAKEQQLQQELKEAEERIVELRYQAAAAGGQFGAVTEEQQRMIAEANRRIVDVRDELRAVQAALRQEIEALERSLRLINILAVPALIAVVGLFVWARRHLQVARPRRSLARS